MASRITLRVSSLCRSRSDGVFFVAISTTGIYCRPVCPAKQAKRENCTFYQSAAAAERAGFRPCLRCRPELAPGNASIDSVSRLTTYSLNRIEEGALTEMSVDELASAIGVTGRHLRRVVRQELGVSPIEIAQTHRLLTAKRLLTDTRLPVIEVAYASGFSSLRRFNALFAERYRLNPTALRRGRHASTQSDTIRCEVAYRPLLDWESLLRFLGDRSSAGIEAVIGDRYLRTAAIGKHRGWVAVFPTPGRNTLTVELSSSLAPALLPILTRVKRLFDLAANPSRIAANLGEIADLHPGLRVPGAFDGFEVAVRAILGQQVSVKAATTLSCRFAAAFVEPIVTPHERLTNLTPTAERVAAAKLEDVTALGVTKARAATILSLARAIPEEGLYLEPGLNPEGQIASLRAQPGIGEWTAQYVAMRALAWPDAFPHSDLGIRKALNETNDRRVLARADAWRPWRAYAVMHLWKSLETKL